MNFSDIQAGSKLYFIADVGSNHEGSLDRAIKLIKLAKEAGADAIKFQHYTAKSLVSSFGFEKLGTSIAHQDSWESSVFDVYKKYETPLLWTEALASECKNNEIDFLTSPYNIDTIDQLSGHVCAWKIGSGDITWLSLIERVTYTKVPILLATGASDMSDVTRAVYHLLSRTNDICLMQCNTNYTGSDSNFYHINLNVLDSYAAHFPGIALGLSDHTKGFITVLGAIAKGARVIEKHFTDDPSRCGPDHSFAMSPSEWRQMVDASMLLFASLGDGVKRIEANESETCVVQRRALRAASRLHQGLTIVPDDLVALRPCPSHAIPPYLSAQLLGKTLKRTIEEGDIITFDDIDN